MLWDINGLFAIHFHEYLANLVIYIKKLYLTHVNPMRGRSLIEFIEPLLIAHIKWCVAVVVCGRELHFVCVAVCGGCSAYELPFVGVALFGSCCVRELRFRGVVVCCIVGEVNCVGVMVVTKT